jgi:hypothetical protein
MITNIDTIFIGGEWFTPSSTNKTETQSPTRRSAAIRALRA